MEVYQVKKNLIGVCDGWAEANGFELDSYYKSIKKYKKNITEAQTLVVVLDGNTVEEVAIEYTTNKFDPHGYVTLETVSTVDQLRLLLAAFKI